THLIRVWDLAHLHFIPNEVSRHELPYPAIYWNLSYRRQLIVHPADTRVWEQYGAEPIDSQGYLYAGAVTRSNYSPVVLFPYALVMRYLGLKYSLSALTVFYASRLAGLAAYTLLAWMAVRLAPFGKWILAIAALAPTAVYQAATINADPVSNGAALLFIAGSLSASACQDVGWRRLLGLVALSSLLFWAKGNMALLALLPLLLLHPSRFRMRGGWLLLAVIMLTLGMIEVGGWIMLGYSGSEGSASSQLAYLATNPIRVLASLLNDLWRSGPKYISQWVGEYGYGYGLVPVAAYVSFGAAAFGAWWADSSHGPIPTRTRWALLVTFAVCVLGTSLAMYMAATPVGADYVEGLQGRYFAPIAPLLALALIGILRLKPFRQASALATSLVVATLAFFAAGLALSYYVVCGTAFYQSGLCYLPAYKNWASNNRFSSPISTTTGLLQELVPECDGMTEIRVWVDGAGLPADGQTSFVARDPAADIDLARAIVANADLPHGGWLSLMFDPQWHSRGKLYLLRITRPQDSSVDGARIALTAREEYPEVKLTENSTPVD
ncbi:MAG: DUF2142 domain-containing protein, partial [Chloroflexi bacterium]|nr:DUF2142 domain-containing protein [Chloroflexota bacterium]